jgi:hypothetical protein
LLANQDKKKKCEVGMNVGDARRLMGPSAIKVQ